MPEKLLDLPADVVGHIVARLELAFHVARAAPTCKVVSVAARNAIRARGFSSEVVVLAGHDYMMSCVAAAPDGRIVTGSHDDTVKVWRDGACERTIQAHTEAVRAVAVLPGGARFISGSWDGTAKLWTLDGELERTIEVDSNVRCVAALPDGVHFVVGLMNKKVRLYHVDGTLVHTFEGHTDWVRALAATPDGQHIISGSDDRLIKVWSVASKSLVSTCAGHTGMVSAVAAMPDGQRILSGGHDNTVRVWLLNGTLENTFENAPHLPPMFSKVHTDAVLALAALSDNQHALSGSVDETVKLFNVNDGAVVRTFKHHTDTVKCLALLPDGLRFVSGSDDNTARIAYHGLASGAS